MSNILTGNITEMGIITVTYDAASQAANDTDEDTVTVSGLKIGDYVALAAPAHEDGIGLCDCRVTADDTLSITWVNSTAGAVDRASADFLLFWARPDATKTATGT